VGYAGEMFGLSCRQVKCLVCRVSDLLLALFVQFIAVGTIASCTCASLCP